MATITDEASAAKLLEAALQTSQGMRAVAEGKPAGTATQSDARSFVGIARLLELLVREVEQQRALARTRGDALARIAELKIRGGSQLVEAGRWQKIAAELREIAGETLASDPAAGARASAPHGPRSGAGGERRG